MTKAKQKEYRYRGPDGCMYYWTPTKRQIRQIVTAYKHATIKMICTAIEPCCPARIIADILKNAGGPTRK